MKTNTKIEKLVHKYLKKEKPDVAISVIPLMNHGILRAARTMNIPFILQTLDLNPKYWANGLTKTDCSYDNFIYAIPFEDSHLKKATHKRKIPRKKLVVSGYPVQSSFLKEYNVEELRKKYGVAAGKKVVMLMMGGVGSSAITTYARRIMKMNLPIHLFICLGKSAHLLPEIKQLRKSPSITYTVFTYTNEIPQLMAASDLIITKAGANSVAEALQMKLPMLLDKTSIFDLERKNIDFATKHQFGEAIKSYRDIDKLLKKYLTNDRLLNRIRENIKTFQPKKFNEVLPGLITSMLEKKEKQEKERQPSS
jgi:processive 1,2-diacylglycerol beta-glucosyltransferase